MTKLINSDATANITLVRNDGAVDIGTPFDKTGELGDEQKIDMADVEVMDSAGVDNYDGGDSLFHETIEAGVIQIQGINNFDNAHSGTNNVGAPGLTPETWQNLTDPKTGNIIGSENTLKIAGRETRIVQTSTFARPFPATDVPVFKNDKQRMEFRSSHPLHITNIRQRN